MSAASEKFRPVHSAAVGNHCSVFIHSLLFREILIFFLSLLFFGYFARMGIDPHHDGVMLIPAIRVAAGQVVFRDVFCQYGLLVPLLQGGAVSLFGAELLVIRMLTVCFYAGSAVLLDLLWKRFLPVKISFLVPVLYCLFSACTMVTFHSWNSVYALFFMLLYGLFMLRYLESDSSSLRNLFFAGIAAGLSWACRSPCGAVTVLAAVLVLLGLNWFTGKNIRQIGKECVSFAGGALLMALLALGYIIGFGAWDDFIKQNFGYVADFVYSRGGGSSWQYFCNSMFPFYQDDLWFCNSFFALLPLAAMGLLYKEVRGGVLDGTEQMRKALPLAALLILGLGSWHQYYPVPCVRHLFWGGAPLFGVFLLMLCRLWQYKGILTKTVVIFGSGILLLGLFPRCYGIAVRAEWGTRLLSETPGIRGIGLNKQEENIVELIKYGDTLGRNYGGFVNWSADSLFSAMVETKGFTDLQFYRMDNRQYPGFDQKVMQYIMTCRPVVLVDHDAFISGYKIKAETYYMGLCYRLLVPVK